MVIRFALALSIMLAVSFSIRSQPYAGDPQSNATGRGFKKSGPFLIHSLGDPVVACKRGDWIERLADPRAEQSMGRINYIQAIEYAGCINLPDGTLVDVKAAGQSIALIFPQITSSSAFFVLRYNITDQEHHVLRPFEPDPFQTMTLPLSETEKRLRR